jgi:hypothetical protein
LKLPDVTKKLKFSDEEKTILNLNDPTNKFKLLYQDKKKPKNITRKITEDMIEYQEINNEDTIVEMKSDSDDVNTTSRKRAYDDSNENIKKKFKPESKIRTNEKFNDFTCLFTEESVSSLDFIAANHKDYKRSMQLMGSSSSTVNTKKQDNLRKLDYVINMLKNIKMAEPE